MRMSFSICRKSKIPLKCIDEKQALIDLYHIFIYMARTFAIRMRLVYWEIDPMGDLAPKLYHRHHTHTHSYWHEQE